MNSRIEMDPFRAWMEAGTGEPLRKSMLHRMERFWEGQRRLLDEYESFSRAMLERRRSAADAAVETLRKMGAAADGAEWAKCCGDWFTGSITRLADDNREMIQESWKMFADLSQAMIEGMGEAAQAPAETVKAAAEAQQSAARAAAEPGGSAFQDAARAAAARAAAQRPKRPDEGARA